MLGGAGGECTGRGAPAAVQGGYLLRDEAQRSIQNIVSDKDSPHTAFKPH